MRFLACVLLVCLVGCSEAYEVAKEELGPRALNEKYEWFKNTHATLVSRRATLRALDGKMVTLREDYEGVSRKDWARDDRQTLTKWQSEHDGIKASYNALAAEYNAEMSKWHTEFVNAGKLPAGDKLGEIPRTVAPYIDQ